jgi:hypothetical protein
MEMPKAELHWFSLSRLWYKSPSTTLSAKGQLRILEARLSRNADTGDANDDDDTHGEQQQQHLVSHVSQK